MGFSAFAQAGSSIGTDSNTQGAATAAAGPTVTFRRTSASISDIAERHETHLDRWIYININKLQDIFSQEQTARYTEGRFKWRLRSPQH